MDAAGRPMSDAEASLAQIERQRAGCAAAGSSIWEAVLRAVAVDVDAGGASERVLRAHAQAPPGDAIVLRLLAGLHEIALSGDDPELAGQLPSAGGAPDVRLGAVAVAAIARHERRLVDAMERCVQTNEPGRVVALLCGLLEFAALGLPLRIFEVGASAGLNLAFDRYRVEADGSAFGPVDSPLRFESPFTGAAPDLAVPVVVEERRGCDLAPIDPTSREGRLRLRSLVWPDHVERRRRLDLALEAVGDRPPQVDRADAVDWLGDRLRPRPGTSTVVVHSIVLQYMPPERRRRLVSMIEAAGAEATERAPIAWLRTEPGGAVAETRLTVWPGGAPRLIATSGFHGPPVDVPGTRRT